MTAPTWTSNANISTSNGGLTATVSGSGNCSSLATGSAQSSNKWYYETTFNTLVSSTYPGAGFATSSLSATNMLGNDSNGIGYYANGVILISGGSPATYGSFSAGAVIGLAIDISNVSDILFYAAINNVWQNSANPALGTGGLNMNSNSFVLGSGILPAMGSASSTSGAALTADFGTTTFTYAPPSGFTRWAPRPVTGGAADSSLQLLLGDSIGWTPSLLGRPLPLLGAAAASGAARLIRSGAKVSRRLLVTGRDR